MLAAVPATKLSDSEPKPLDLGDVEQRVSVFAFSNLSNSASPRASLGFRSAQTSPGSAPEPHVERLG